MAKTRFLKQIFCPLTKSYCRTDCRWCYLDWVIDEDGVDEIVNCAVNLIVEIMDSEEWEDYV